MISRCKTKTKFFVFLPSYIIFTDCGSNISSVNYGIIASPNFPNKYDGPARNMASKTCNWFIRVRPNQRILLNFESFSVEGDQSGISFFFLFLFEHHNYLENTILKEMFPFSSWLSSCRAAHVVFRIVHAY